MLVKVFKALATIAKALVKEFAIILFLMISSWPYLFFIFFLANAFQPFAEILMRVSNSYLIANIVGILPIIVVPVTIIIFGLPFKSKPFWGILYDMIFAQFCLSLAYIVLDYLYVYPPKIRPTGGFLLSITLLIISAIISFSLAKYSRKRFLNSE